MAIWDIDKVMCTGTATVISYVFNAL